MMPAFCNTVHRTARKRHICNECRGHIEPGDVYEYVAGLWDGDFSSFKTCIHCETARNFYVGDCDSRSFRDWDDGEFTFGSVRDDLFEFAKDCRPGTGLKFGAYRHAIGIERRGDVARAERAGGAQ